MEIWKMIISLFGALGGLTTFIGLIVFFREIKRKKTNEADSGEIENLTKIISEISKARENDKKERQELITRVETLEKRDLEREKLLIDIERSLNIHKRAVNAQTECFYEKAHTCPVIIKLKELSQ